MIPSHRIPTHPGEILRDQFLTPLGMSQRQLAKVLGVSIKVVTGLIDGDPITVEMAGLLSREFKTSPEFWLNVQSAHDLAKARP